MPFKPMDPSEEYKKCKDLRKEDVTSLQEWAEKQPHLPRLSGMINLCFIFNYYIIIDKCIHQQGSFFLKNPLPCLENKIFVS